MSPTPPKRALYRRLLSWSRTLHTYLSMLAVVLFFFFGATGFMLNHAEWFGLDVTQSTTQELTLPETALQGDKLALVEYLRANAHVTGAVEPFDWPGEGEAFHVGFKSPRAHSDVDIALETRIATITTETRGIAGLMTRLHTAREAGFAWQLLLDASAILLIAASLTGIVLWQSLPKRRVLGLVALVASIAGVVGVYLAMVP